MEAKEFIALLDEGALLFRRLSVVLQSLIEAAKVRDTEKITSDTAELVLVRDEAVKFETRLVILAKAAAQKRGLDPKDFKLASLDTNGLLADRLDQLKKNVSEVASKAAQVSGILTANVTVIEETIKVLQSLDARAVGYGSSASPARPARLWDQKA